TPALAGESGAARAVVVRGPALDRHGDPGPPRQPGGEPPGRPHAPPRQLPPRVPARLGEQDLLYSAPARPLALRARRRAPAGVGGRRARPAATQANLDRAH